MLLNYGFIDPAQIENAAKTLILPLDDTLLPRNYRKKDDPLFEAKLQVFGSAPTLELRIDEKSIPRWTAPFLYLLCVNERDGVSFKAVEEAQGHKAWRMLWQGRHDITSMAGMFEVFLNARDEGLRGDVQYRAVGVLVHVVEAQLGRMKDAGEEVLEGAAGGGIREFVAQVVGQLGGIEKEVLEMSLVGLRRERDRLD